MRLFGEGTPKLHPVFQRLCGGIRRLGGINLARFILEPDGLQLLAGHMGGKNQFQRQHGQTGRTGIHSLATQSGCKGGAGLEVEHAILGGFQPAVCADSLAPDQTHLRIGRQRAATLQRQQSGLGLLPGLTLQLHAGLAITAGQERGVVILQLAGLLQHLVPGLPIQHIHPDPLLEPRDLTVGMLAQRRHGHGRVRRQQENLLLIDGATALLGQAPGQRRSSGVEFKLALARERASVQRPCLGPQAKAAGQTRDQIPVEIHHPGPRVRPASRTARRTLNLEGRRQPGIAQRHHGRRKPDADLPDALDPALRAEGFDRCGRGCSGGNGHGRGRGDGTFDRHRGMNGQ